MADPISRRTYPEQAEGQQTTHFGATTRSQRTGTHEHVSPGLLPDKSLSASMHEVTVSAFQEGYKVDAFAQEMFTKGDLSSAQGLLWHGDALMVPKHDSLRQDVLYKLHDASISGHPGIRRTKKLVRSYCWPGIGY